MKRNIISIVLLFYSVVGTAQELRLGAGFGFYIRNNQGVNIVSDSIVVEGQGSRSQSNVFSIFGEYDFNKVLSFRSSINLTNQRYGFLLYNKEIECAFCPVNKAYTIGGLNFNVVNKMALLIPVKSIIEFRLLGGIRSNFNFIDDELPISFRNGEIHQGLAEAINQLDQTIKPFYFNYILGLSASWRRFNLIIELDKNIGRTITKNMNIYGESYPFTNRTNTFTFTLNYSVFKFQPSQ